MYDIVIRFPTQEMADNFCEQMSDGFGEGLCDFSFHRRIEGTDGKKRSDYERIVTQEDEIPAGTKVFFINSIMEF